MKKNGYMNASDLCDQTGKQFKMWRYSAGTAELLHRVSKIENISIDQLIIKFKNNTNERITGTYLHHQLFLDITMWCNMDYWNGMYKIIQDYTVNKITHDKDIIIRKKNKKIAKLGKEMNEQTKEMIRFRNMIARKVVISNKQTEITLLETMKDDCDYLHDYDYYNNFYTM